MLVTWNAQSEDFDFRHYKFLHSPFSETSPEANPAEALPGVLQLFKLLCNTTILYVSIQTNIVFEAKFCMLSSRYPMAVRFISITCATCCFRTMMAWK